MSDVDERTFLLRSIADLDAEYAAGDIGEADYAALRDDYVARAAAELRGDDAAVAQPRPPRLGRNLAVVGACLLVAAVAGVALANAAGSRSTGAALTGSLPTTTQDRLSQAAAYVQQGKAVEAIKLYDAILKDDPKHPVALANRGWLVRLAGLQAEGLTYVDRAIVADPSYPDAHFFRGMMLWQDQHDPASAVAEFRLFLANRPPSEMVGVVENLLKKASAEAGIPTG
jgi:tetratricopeptide (TPR) repeat protein